MKRKLKWMAVVLVVLLLGSGVALFLSPRDRITAESWKKIRIGMTAEEVEGILGVPGKSLEEADAKIEALATQMGKPPFIYDNGIFLQETGFGESELRWIGRHGMIVLHIDAKDHVSGKFFQGWRSADPTFLDRLRDWLGW